MFLPKDTKVENLPSLIRKYDLYQNYFKAYSNAPMLSDTIIKMKNDGEVTEYEVDLAEFFYHARFATEEMFLEFYSDYLNKAEKDRIKNRERLNLNRLLENRIISEFTISTEENPTFPKSTDSLFKVYTLDMGGLGLVTNYRNYYDIWDFKLTNNFVSVERVAKELITTKFYLKLKDLNVRGFTKRPLVYVGERAINPDFKLILKTENSVPYFFGEVILKDFNEETTREMLLGYESLERTKHWMKYSKQEPVSLFICEDEDTLQRFAKLTDRVFMERMRFTTFERLKKPLYEEGTFLKKDNGELLEVVSNHFKP